MFTVHAQIVVNAVYCIYNQVQRWRSTRPVEKDSFEESMEREEAERKKKEAPPPQ
jgi:hypothetical protein